MAKQEEGGIRIRIRGLEDGLHSIDISSTAEVLELPMFQRDLKIQAKMIKDGTRVTIDGRVQAEADLDCSRCTEPIHVKVDAPLHVKLIPPPIGLDGYEIEGFETDDDTHIYEAFSSSSFDILQDVLDAIGVAVPMKPLCKPRCQGLCPRCGTNWNTSNCDCEQPVVESAWTSSLKDLQAKLRSKEQGDA